MVDENILTHFGNNLRIARSQKGLSQEKLALLLNFDRTYISLLERGKRNPSLITIYKISKTLEIHISQLLP